MAFYEILLLTLLPTSMVVLVTYFLVKSFLERESFQRKIELSSLEKKQTLGIKAQACERLVLFIERLSPNSLMLRMNNPTVSARALQGLLLKSVREEFEHNFAQQIYVSETTWNLVKASKDEVLALINNCSGNLAENAKGSDLVREVLSAEPNRYYPSLAKARKAIRIEMSKYL
jgi:hypothetical protein